MADMPMSIDRRDRLLALRRMASSQVCPSHRPSIATSLIVLSAACLLPFLALPSSTFFANAFPQVADTFWSVLLSIVKSSRFYFFLLNFLIVTLVCSSRILSPLSNPRDFDESRAGDPDYSAAHALHERLAVDQFYESQIRSPAYLRLFEGSNICTADEVVDDCTDKRKVKHDLSLSLQGPTFTDVYARDDLTASRLRAENTSEALTFEMLDVTNSSSMEKTLEIPHGNIRRVNIGSADRQDFNAGRHITKDETQVSDGDDERDQEVDNEADIEKYADAGGRSDGDEGNRPAQHDALEDDATVDDGLDSEDGGNSVKELNSPLQTQDLTSQKTEEMMAGAYEQVKENNENGGGQLDENVGVDGGEKNAEEEDRGEEKADAFEEGEGELQIMSREELNKRVSAFITAFRRKHGYKEGG